MSVSWALALGLVVCVVPISCAAAGRAEGAIYSLVLASNGPATVALGRLNVSSGGVEIVGGHHTVLDGMGSLSCVDPGRRIYYYLGDSSEGTTLLGIDLSTGVEVCKGPIPFKEIGYVGIGQTLDFDTVSKTLVMTGLVPKPGTNSSSYLHGVIRTQGCSAAGGVTTLHHLGTFADADFVPLIHASSIDSAAQQLFLSIATSKTTGGTGVVDLKTLKLSVAPYDSLAHSMVGMQYDKSQDELLSLTTNYSSGGLDLVSLASTQNGFRWKVSPCSDKYDVWELYGNSGTVSAIDVASGYMYALAGVRSGRRQESPTHLLRVSTRRCKILHSSLVTNLPLGTNSILEMVWVAG